MKKEHVQQAYMNIKPIIETLKPMIVGKEIGPFECDCGCIKLHTGIATEINYPKEAAYQLGLYYLWSVLITEKDSDKQYSVGLSEFVDRKFLVNLFDTYFKQLELE